MVSLAEICSCKEQHSLNGLLFVCSETLLHIWGCYSALGILWCGTCCIVLGHPEIDRPSRYSYVANIRILCKSFRLIENSPLRCRRTLINIDTILGNIPRMQNIISCEITSTELLRLICFVLTETNRTTSRWKKRFWPFIYIESHQYL